MLLLGVPIGVAYLNRASPRTELPSGRLRALAIGAAAVLGAASALLLFAQLLPIGLDLGVFDTWREVVNTTVFGWSAFQRVLLAAGMLAVFALVRGQNARAVVSVVGGLLANATITRGSHTAAMEAGPQALLADYANLFGGALWAGGLLALGRLVEALEADGDRREGGV